MVTGPDGAQVKRAIQLRNIVTSLGPAYIKLGQALSIRPDILSPAAMVELQKLCDKVPSFNNEDAMQVIHDELGAPWHEVRQPIVLCQDCSVHTHAHSLCSVQHASVPSDLSSSMEELASGFDVECKQERGSDAGACNEQVYAELSPRPIAAASLGQVYKGKLKTGETVAVKVQRPYVLETVTIDLFVIRCELPCCGRMTRMMMATKCRCIASR
jgi:predicted unusual protein kinase regulating ubiquinone biosynthesis (AarF/ABC1/UbiB family)